MLSVKFGVGVSLLLAPAEADKRGPMAPFSLVVNAGVQPAICKKVPPELQREPGLTESTAVNCRSCGGLTANGNEAKMNE